MIKRLGVGVLPLWLLLLPLFSLSVVCHFTGPVSRYYTSNFSIKDGQQCPLMFTELPKNQNHHVYGLKWAVVDSFMKERLRAETLGLLRDTNPRSLLFFLVDLHCPALLHKLK